MAIPMEVLEKEYEGKEKDMYYWQMQAVVGTEADKKNAFDRYGNFQCIKWFNCSYCPAFREEYCI